MYKVFVRIRHIWNAYPVFVVLILFTLNATFISRCNLFDGLKFIFVQIAFIYLPGFVLQKMTGIGYQSKLIRGLVSYATGYALSILIYLIMLMMSLHHYVMYLYIGIFLLSAIALFKMRPTVKDECSEAHEDNVFSYILFFSFCISCLFFQCKNLSPLLKEGNVVVNQDLVFWMRNAVAATKSYPLPEMSVFGKEFFYHYFTSIEIAFLHYTTNIEILDLCFTYSYLITIFLVVSGLYIICRCLISSFKIAIWAICFIHFTTGLEEYTHIFFSPHIFTVSFGLAEGIAFFCFSFYYYLRIIQNDENKRSILVVLMLFLFACTGLKGPIAAILLVGIAVGSISMMFFKKQYAFGMISGLLLLLSFLICMSLFVVNVNGPAESGSSPVLTVSAYNTIFHSHFYERLYIFLINIGLPQLLSYLFTVILYLISVFLIPLIIVILLYGKKRMTVEDFILVSMIICGVLLGLFVSQNGMSQMYFFFPSIICMFLFVFSYCSIRMNNSFSIITIKITFVVGLSLFLFNNLGTGISGLAGLVHSVETECILGKKNRPAVESVENGMSINRDEVVGLRWLRDNSSSDAVVLSNKVLSSDMGARSFWVSSISERQTFFESYDYSNVSEEKIKNNCNLIRSFYKGDVDALKAVKNQGVTHAVIFKGIEPNRYPEECNIIYKNEKMIILEL